MDYHKEIEAIQQGCTTSGLDLFRPESAERRNFLLTSANKSNLLPAVQEAEDFYREVIKHQHLAAKESEILPYIGHHIDLLGDSGILRNGNDRPFIFCSFHLGSFHSWPELLGRYGINFTVVISERSFHEQHEELHGKMEDLRREKGYRFNFNMINAEDPSCVVQMIRELKNKNSLLLFIDGNSGVGGNTRNDSKLIDISFMGKNIFARKGIASVAYVTGTPIVPLLSYRSAGRIKQIILPPVLPDKRLDRETSVKNTTQHLYDLFSVYLKQYPEQWEGWQYINNCLDLNSLKVNLTPGILSVPPEEATFNNKRYGLLKENGACTLFDAYTYKVFKITEGLYLFLMGFDQQSVDHRTRISPELYNDLVVNQVIC